MHEFMGTRPDSFNDLKISIDLAENKEAFLEKLLNTEIRFSNTGTPPVRTHRQTLHRRLPLNIHPIIHPHRPLRRLRSTRLRPTIRRLFTFQTPPLATFRTLPRRFRRSRPVLLSIMPQNTQLLLRRRRIKLIRRPTLLPTLTQPRILILGKVRRTLSYHKRLSRARTS